MQYSASLGMHRLHKNLKLSMVDITRLVVLGTNEHSMQNEFQVLTTIWINSQRKRQTHTYTHVRARPPSAQIIHLAQTTNEIDRELERRIKM